MISSIRFETLCPQLKQVLCDLLAQALHYKSARQGVSMFLKISVLFLGLSLITACAEERPDYGDWEQSAESFSRNDGNEAFVNENPNYRIIERPVDVQIFQTEDLERSLVVQKTSETSATIRIRYILTNASASQFGEINLLQGNDADLGFEVLATFDGSPLDVNSGGAGTGQIQGSGEITVEINTSFARFADSGRLLIEVIENIEGVDQKVFSTDTRTDVLSARNQVGPAVITNHPGSLGTQELPMFGRNLTNRDIATLNLSGRDFFLNSVVDFAGINAIREVRWYFVPVDSNGTVYDRVPIAGNSTLSRLFPNFEDQNAVRAIMGSEFNSNISSMIRSSEQAVNFSPGLSGDARSTSTLQFTKTIPRLRGNFYAVVTNSVPSPTQMGTLDNYVSIDSFIKDTVNGWETHVTESRRFRVEVE